ncbi:MAG: hypothetical protein IPM38_00035 [Ignavibacteria bacterium]|nr:hypothetical protein [Ignavibacteria bacterium]
MIESIAVGGSLLPQFGIFFETSKKYSCNTNFFTKIVQSSGESEFKYSGQSADIGVDSPFGNAGFGLGFDAE